jgi:hypothetical protein
LYQGGASNEAGQSGEGKRTQARPSFLKKRSKKLLPVLASAFPDGLSPDNQKFFGSRRPGAAFFSKKNRFLPSPDCPVKPRFSAALSPRG